MAHFYAQVFGRAKTHAGRVGTKKTGVRGHVRGWDIGAFVEMRHVEEGARDQVEVHIVRGSNDGLDALVGAFVASRSKKDGGAVVTQLSASFLSIVTDEAWAQVLAHPAVAAIIKKQLFLHLDKANG